MSKFSICLAFSFLLPGSGHLRGAEIPSTPKTLLTALPKLPGPVWKLTASTGKTSFSSWLVSEGSRKYLNAETGQTVAITIRDTGSHSSELRRFQNIVPADFPHLVRGEVNGRPTQILRSEISTTLDTLIDARLILTVRCDGFEHDEAMKWIETHIDFPTLARLPRSGFRVLPREVPIVFIDELHPAANRSATRPAYAAARDEGRQKAIEREEQIAKLTPEQRRTYEAEVERRRHESDKRYVEKFLTEAAEGDPTAPKK